MAYSANPFLEKRSDRTTSDQEFVRLFSPKILERLPDNLFQPGVHVLHSPPGGGKTTLLRSLTPGALRGFWVRRTTDVMEEAIARLEARDILDREHGPRLLGVMLSSAAGYADLPPGASIHSEGLFRALFDCRIVLRTLRALVQLLGYDQSDCLDSIGLEYSEIARDLKSIPSHTKASDLMIWAERTERQIYAKLDEFDTSRELELPTDVRFEGILWLEGVRFFRNGKEIGTRRLLMIDDLHKLRDSQRNLLKTEATELRPTIPIWLAQRTIAFGSSLLSQGAREGRDASEHSLDELWSTGRGHQPFSTFARNVLDRRMAEQKLIHSQSFEPHLGDDLRDDEILEHLLAGVEIFQRFAEPFRRDHQYSEWLDRAYAIATEPSLNGVANLFMTRMQIVRNQRRKQMRLDLTPLPAEALEDRDSSKDEHAAEIFMHEELKIPYYFGMERLSTLATYNVEELLNIASALYDGLRTKQVLRHRDPVLTPHEQEKIILDVAKKKLAFISRSHTQGTRAQRLLSALGEFCRSRTFELNAPYAPGVTGFKVSDAEYVRLEKGDPPYGDEGRMLVRVLFECVAENLLVQKATSATTNRESGYVFYLNRTICAHFGLPLQYGGWQEIDTEDLITWIQRGPTPVRRKRLLLEE